MKRSAAIVIIVLVLIGAGYLAYKNKANTSVKMPADQEVKNVVNQEPAATPETGTVKGDVKEFTVVGGNFTFSIASMKVSKGDKVRVIFQNEEGFHDFRIDEFNVATQKIKAGAEEIVEFTADKTGTFEYYCSVGTHRAMGMKGTLIVE